MFNGSMLLFSVELNIIMLWYDLCSLDRAKNLEQLILDAEREGDQDLVKQLETAYATLKRKTTKKPPDQGPTIKKPPEQGPTIK